MMRLLIAFVSLFMLCNCHAPSNVAPDNPAGNAETFSSTPPFSTHEPEQYRAVRTVVFTDTSGHSQTFKTLIARDGVSRREETTLANGGVLVSLSFPGGVFLLLPAAAIYSEAGRGSETTEPPVDTAEQETPEVGSSESRYQSMGTEQLNGARVNKFRVIVNGSAPGGANQTEAIVWVDEKLGMVVRSETKSLTGNLTTTDLTEISNTVDKTMFQIPVNYTKVPLDNLRKLAGSND